MAIPSQPIPVSLQKSLDATKVEYVQLGSSGLRVSSPIFGVMGIGSKQWMPGPMGEEDGMNLLKAAWDRGLSTWDTANVYSSGVSEEIVGKTIKEFDIPRHKLTILTKIMGTVPETPEIFSWTFESQMAKTKDYVNNGGLSRGAIIKAVDASLKRLGTDYIDLLQIHRFDPTVPIEETMKALHDVVESGKVHYIGASSMWTYQFARMQFVAEKNGWTKFISMQNTYNLLYREEEREMNKFCKETGVGIIPYGALSHGLLSRPLDSEETPKTQFIKMLVGGISDADSAIINRVQELAEKKGCNMTQIALRWVKDKGCIPIVGLWAFDLQRLDEACALKDISLTDDEMTYLDEPYLPKAVRGHT